MPSLQEQHTSHSGDTACSAQDASSRRSTSQDDPRPGSIGRADDEKTIRDEQPDNDFSKEKDIEAGKTGSTKDEVVVQVESDHEEDNFPEGGLKAWLNVLGVRPRCSSRAHERFR